MTWKSDELVADISSNNPSFNAAQYASAGHLAVGIKATEGETFINPDYVAWVTDAHAHGLAVIHYHFAIPTESASAQMLHFWDTAKEHFRRPGDWLALDVETGSAASGAAWTRQADAALKLLSRTNPWLYTFKSFYDEGLAGAVSSGLYWIAAWGAREPAMRRGHRLMLWQYTDGDVGPQPHLYAGIPANPGHGGSDGSVITDRHLQARLRKDHRHHA